MEYIINKDENNPNSYNIAVRGKEVNQIFESWNQEGNLRVILMDLIGYNQSYAAITHLPEKPIRITLERGFGLSEKKMTKTVEKISNLKSRLFD